MNANPLNQQNSFMTKVRYWDTRISKWIVRHFHVLFFQIILFVILIFWMVNTVNVVFNSAEISRNLPQSSLAEKIMITNSVNQAILVLLLFFNSFWMLYIFSGMQRMMTLLKDINYSIIRSRPRSNRPPRRNDQKYS